MAHADLYGLELPSVEDLSKRNNLAQETLDFLAVERVVARQINLGLQRFTNQAFLVEKPDGAGFEYRAQEETFLSYLWKDLARRFSRAKYIRCERCKRQTEARSKAKKYCRTCINKAHDDDRAEARRSKRKKTTKGSV